MQEENNKQLTLEEIKSIELNILLEFDAFCKKNNITYFLAYGTLIGAIRHQGFIPWDDDIDVIMPRPDYEKFKSISYSTPIKENYISVSYDSPSYKSVYPYLKIIDINTVAIEQNLPDQKTGIWIDIFPVDALPNSDKIRSKIFKRNLIQKRLFRILTNNSSFTKNIIKKVAIILLKPLRFFVKVNTLCKKMNTTATKYRFGSTKYAGALLWGNGPEEAFPTEIFTKTKTTSFEGYPFNIIEDYDKFLTQLYGDYMQLPPEDQRPVHNIKAYILNDKK